MNQPCPVEVHEQAFVDAGPVPGDNLGGLPPGVHPMDPATVGAADATAAPQDTPGARHNGTGKPPFHTETSSALGVFQRKNHDFTANTFILSAGTPALEVIGRQKGRGTTYVSCPSVASVAGSVGFIVGPSEAEVLNGVGGVAVYPGESVTIESEAPVWIGLLAGQTSCICRVVSSYNPPGGGLGGQ